MDEWSRIPNNLYFRLIVAVVNTWAISSSRGPWDGPITPVITRETRRRFRVARAAGHTSKLVEACHMCEFPRNTTYE